MMKRGDVVRLVKTGHASWDIVYAGQIAIVRHVLPGEGVFLEPPPDDLGPMGFFWLWEIEAVSGRRS